MDSASNEQIATFAALTGAPPSEAAFFLQTYNNNLEMAVNEYFLAMEEGGGAAPMDAAGGPDSDEGEEGEEGDDDDDSDGDAEMAMVSGYANQGPATPSSSVPPPKRAKVEMRQAPSLDQADPPAEALTLLQQVFRLQAKPKDAADQLHKVIKERMHSWAYQDDRGVPYLLGCFARLPAAASTDAQRFARECVLHHTRTALLSGETSDEGLDLFEDRSEGSELSSVLKMAGGSAFLTAVNDSMTAAEQDQVYCPMIEDLLAKLAAAIVVVGAPPSTSSSSAPPIGWRAALAEVELLLGLADSGGGALKPLEHGGAAREVLARRLRDEAALLRKGTWNARDAETMGALRLFAASPSGLLTATVGAKRAGGSGGHHEDDTVTKPAQHDVYEMQKRLRLMLTAALLKKAETRAHALEWIGAVAQANVNALDDHVAASGPEAVLRAPPKGSGEACLLSLATVMLQLCEPFLTPSAERNGKGHDGFTRLDPAWFRREQLKNAVARGSRRREPTLRHDAAHDAGGGGGAELGKDGDFEMDAKDAAEEDELAQAIKLSLSPSKAAEAAPAAAGVSGGAGAGSSSAEAAAASAAAAAASSDDGVTATSEFHFVSECFFLALRSLRVALVPITRRAERYTHELARKSKMPPLLHPASAAASEALSTLKMAGLGPMQHTVLAYRAMLEGDELQQLLLRFLSLTAAWLLQLGEQPDAAKAFALLPEACVTDLCELLVLSARSPARERLSRDPAAAAIVSRFCCDWLGRRELLASPFVRYSMSEVLSTLVEADALQRGGGFGHGQVRLFDLIDAPAAERVQAPLMGLYVELGLHTKADAVTDKNGQRYAIMRVLRKLWEMPQVWRQLQALAAASASASPSAQEAMLGDFATTLAKELIFLLDDALGRLADVKARQDAMADEAAWKALTARQKDEREKRLEQVKRTAKGFLELAKASLRAMLHLTADADVIVAFTGVPARARKLASLLGEFLKKLCGPECQSLRVREGEKLGWQPKQMLTDTTELLLNCTKQPGFVEFLRDADSVEAAILAKAHHILKEKIGNFPPLKLDALGAVIGQLQRAEGGGGGAGGGAGGAAGGDADVFARVTAAEAAEATPDLFKRVDAAYAEAQRPLAFDELEMEGTTSLGYEHYYRQNIADNPQDGIAKPKLKRLMRELGKLSEEGSLPVSAEGAIYVMRDANRMDVLKVLISGPADVLRPEQGETPYALGLFEFHIFVPQDYPNVSPLVNLQTTGDGLVRFNPNLYSDGKVCLSLLGTWHGEGWMPPSAGNSGSTILQVLVSIQSIIMVPKPYFNEPGYAEEEGTPAGEQRSREYNDNIRLATLRHAVRDMLRRPPAGFEQIVHNHFKLLRPVLERQVKRWVGEALHDKTREAMLRTYAELQPLLDKLDAAAPAAAAPAAAASSGADGDGDVDMQQSDKP